MKKYWLIALMTTLILLIWLFTPGIASVLHSSCKDYTSLGEFGDMFGVVNVLFSGLTLIFLVYTIKQANDQKTLNSYQRFEDNFFKLIDLHLNHSKELKDSFAKFEEHNIVPIHEGGEAGLKDRYRASVETKHVIKNFINYLSTFEFILTTIQRKRDLDTRKKYFKLYFAQLHINERRFLLYHFNLGTKKPDQWDELKEYLFDGLSREHIFDKLRNYDFDGLAR